MPPRPHTWRSACPLPLLLILATPSLYRASADAVLLLAGGATSASHGFEVSSSDNAAHGVDIPPKYPAKSISLSDRSANLPTFSTESEHERGMPRSLLNIHYRKVAGVTKTGNAKESPAKGGSTARPKKRRSRMRKSIHELATICWDGPAEFFGGQELSLDPETQEDMLHPIDSEHNILIAGEGCARCRTGELCRFTLSFASELYFDFASPFVELMVTLSGPTVVAAEVHGGQHTSLNYVVSYLVWDSGIYKVTVEGNCPSEAFKGSVLSSFHLRVYDSPEGISPGTLPSYPAETPCETGQYARWVLEGDEGYERQIYRPYPCASGLTPVLTFPLEMVEKKIYEISLIGDEHQRNFLFHLQYLLTGHVTGGLSEDIVWNYKEHSTGRNLRINFYWLDGMFEDGYFECFDRGRISRRTKVYPQYSPTSDVVIVNDGMWTFTKCKRPEQAYPHYLPKLLDAMMEAPHKSRTKFVWRSTPPYPVPSTECDGPRNSGLVWANGIARRLVEELGWQYMDLWPVEAVAFDDTCENQDDAEGLGQWVKGFTFSCLYHNYSKAYGAIGEAVVRTVVHLLVNLELDPAED